MKQFHKWRSLFGAAALIWIVLEAISIINGYYFSAGFLLLLVLVFGIPFLGFVKDIRDYGVKTEVDISRVLGKDAKEALSFGGVGILTYNNEYVVTWASDYFAQKGIDLVNKKLTSWIERIRILFDEDVDVIRAEYQDTVYEITRKQDSQLLFVKDITQLDAMEREVNENRLVVGLVQLDNYMEYQSYENEELMAHINTQLRSPVVTWAQDNGILIRRLRSDRFILVLNQEIFKRIRKQNFSILQIIKDKANHIGVSITLSMSFAYGTNDFKLLDTTINELIELAQSRGGDQAAIKDVNGSVEYVGGNSEMSSARSKVRVRILSQTLQDALKESDEIYIAGHIMSDFDCMGACLSISSWAHTLKKNVYIVLKDVPRDAQLQSVMDHYIKVMKERHVFITPEQARERMDFAKDLLVMVDHGIPAISSAKEFVEECQRVIVIDHHRRNENFIRHAILTYVESSASSTCELIVEMLQNIPDHVPIFEAEATIMYLGILVDTNRFKMHTDARTFEAAAALNTWGANVKLAEKALCEDYAHFTLKHSLIQLAKPYMDHFMIVCEEEKKVDKTTLAQVSEALLLIKGCTASFTIACSNEEDAPTCCSARSDGTFNVQKVMEKLYGGGHFSAAASSTKELSPQEYKQALLEIIKEETSHESHPVE